MSQGQGLLTGCLDCQIGGISCQTNQSTDDLTRVKVYIIVAFPSMLPEVKRSVSSLWNYGFHYALLSETGFKEYANGVA